MMRAEERRGIPQLPSAREGGEVFMARTAEAVKELFLRDAEVKRRLAALEKAVGIKD